MDEALTDDIELATWNGPTGTTADEAIHGSTGPGAGYRALSWSHRWISHCAQVNGGVATM